MEQLSNRLDKNKWMGAFVTTVQVLWFIFCFPFVYDERMFTQAIQHLCRWISLATISVVITDDWRSSSLGAPMSKAERVSRNQLFRTTPTAPIHIPTLLLFTPLPLSRNSNNNPMTSIVESRRLPASSTQRDYLIAVNNIVTKYSIRLGFAKAALVLIIREMTVFPASPPDVSKLSGCLNLYATFIWSSLWVSSQKYSTLVQNEWL